jgi:hypothetical protein
VRQRLCHIWVDDFRLALTPMLRKFSRSIKNFNPMEGFYETLFSINCFFAPVVAGLRFSGEEF